MYLAAYVLNDVKTGIYHPPYFFHNDADAIRTLLSSCTPGTQLYSHPEDFVLYAVGGFDGATGMLHPGEIRGLGSIASLLAATKKVVEFSMPSSNAAE